MSIALFLDDPAAVVEPGGSEKARDIEPIGQPIDVHRKVPLQFINEVLRQIGVGALVVGVCREGVLFGHAAPNPDSVKSAGPL